MEFPDLGKHCSESTCKKLDFLPVKCDACSQIFCMDHMTYTGHACESAYKKNVQVPVCPLCNTPIPSTRGDPPDIAVSAHIDSQCQSQPAKNRRKVYTHRCALKGCKSKEMIALVCNECTLNFCLKHRHASDHKCQGKKAALSNRAASAAESRRQLQRNNSNSNTTRTIQGDMDEDEALARALQLSMNQEVSWPPRNEPITAHHGRSQASNSGCVVS
ncbi:AN1-type zinc finger protein 2A [Nilaparvata lugens]|uniref:AN1-type zinc finger protein 2A n=1 Tax=Nilaparvata lugens TaxID=108931 RepID=UPI00193EAF8D|nr:AN1-type zinc finger protein 2A [Nilaparvata lugens]